MLIIPIYNVFLEGFESALDRAHYEHTAERLKADLASKRAAYFDSSN